VVAAATDMDTGASPAATAAANEAKRRGTAESETYGRRKEAADGGKS
jgi:hypothetical protein